MAKVNDGHQAFGHEGFSYKDIANIEDSVFLDGDARTVVRAIQEEVKEYARNYNPALHLNDSEVAISAGRKIDVEPEECTLEDALHLVELGRSRVEPIDSYRYITIIRLCGTRVMPLIVRKSDSYPGVYFVFDPFTCDDREDADQLLESLQRLNSRNL